MTEPQDTEIVGASYPASEWLRTVEFVDLDPDDGQTPPVHIATKVLFNGEPTEVRLSNEARAMVHTARALGNSETVVSFVVFEDDVVIPNYREITNGMPPNEPKVGGLRVLVPPLADREHMWAVFKTEQDGPEKGKAWVRVYVYLTSVAFRSGEQKDGPGY